MGAKQNLNYQLGLLHFAHLLATVDGFIDEREKRAIKNLQHEENIADEVFHQFEKTVSTKSERDLYNKGSELLNTCTEQEKLCALVHLYRMAEADEQLHVKEVRLLLYSLKSTNVEFDEVIFVAKQVNEGKNCFDVVKG